MEGIWEDLEIKSGGKLTKDGKEHEITKVSEIMYGYPTEIHEHNLKIILQASPNFGRMVFNSRNDFLNNQFLKGSDYVELMMNHNIIESDAKGPVFTGISYTRDDFGNEVIDNSLVTPHVIFELDELYKSRNQNKDVRGNKRENEKLDHILKVNFDEALM